MRHILFGGRNFREKYDSKKFLLQSRDYGKDGSLRFLPVDDTFARLVCIPRGSFFTSRPHDSIDPYKRIRIINYFLLPNRGIEVEFRPVISDRDILGLFDRGEDPNNSLGVLGVFASSFGLVESSVLESEDSIGF